MVDREAESKPRAATVSGLEKLLVDMPTTDQLIDNYIRALGGAVAIGPLIGGDRMPDGRDKVGQRLPGSRAGLHRDMLTGLDRLVHRRCHGDLAGTLRAADAGYRGGQQLGYVREGGAGKRGTGHSGTLPRAGAHGDSDTTLAPRYEGILI